MGLFLPVGKQRQIISVREVINEINSYNREDRLTQWVKNNPKVFELPTDKETEFIKEIFGQTHFLALIEQKKLLGGKPVADPFVVAKAKITGRYVVTQEEFKEQAAKIPNVCQFFNISYTNLEGFMELENLKF